MKPKIWLVFILVLVVTGIIIALYFLLLPDTNMVFRTRGAELPVEKDNPPNVILILVDALRFDSLGCYGYPRETSPSLDKLAGQSILFENARSQAACTFPSVNSMLTSRYPFLFLREFGEREFGIPDELPFLPEILKAEGYMTIAVSSSPIIRSTPSKDFRVKGYGRGFDVFEEYEWKDAAFINAAASKRLEKATEPFFLYLHYMDPHDPYDPPREFRNAFGPPYEGKDFILRGDPNPILQMITDNDQEITVTDEDIQHLRDLYDAEVAFTDQELGKMIEFLAHQDYLDNSLVIICADHGEEFFEHGTVKHCMTVYESLTHVPLVIRMPMGRPAGRRQALVQNLDIVPTILDYAGIERQEFGFQGRSLRPVIEKDEEINAYAYCAQYNWRSVTDGRFKLIINVRTGVIEMYDIRSDPDESENLIDIETETARELLRILKEWISEEEAGLTDAQRIKLSEEAIERLRTLGYFK